MSFNSLNLNKSSGSTFKVEFSVLATFSSRFSVENERIERGDVDDYPFLLVNKQGNKREKREFRLISLLQEDE